jgi:putative radical SAM enzyme (TIGR03279 family)
MDKNPTNIVHGAEVESIQADSPAARAGLLPGMVIATAQGKALRDYIDWLWLSDGSELELTAWPESFSTNSDSLKAFTLQRELGETWGIEFSQPIFDDLMTCNNDCGFCFTKMLPPGLRASLYVRDDDYRLSFLQGSFVTLSNLHEADIERIIEQHISPLYVSLHAVDPTIRQQLFGCNAERGLANLETLLAEKIDVHCQIVLLPGVNDGAILTETLAWTESKPNILSVGIVPYAYTRLAEDKRDFTTQQAKELVRNLKGLAPRVQLADEWFLMTSPHVPAANYYADYPQFHNGIGMLRSFIDDWQSLSVPVDRDKHAAVVVTSNVFAAIFQRLSMTSPWAQSLKILPVENHFFGGSIHATGLLTAADIIQAFQTKASNWQQHLTVYIPDVVFNSEGLTLDGYSLQQLAETLGRDIQLISFIDVLLGPDLEGGV